MFYLMNRSKIVNLISNLGILCFLLLFVYAACHYPGGSQFDADSIGFDWVNNYWCDLLFSPTSYGKENPSKPIAIAAMSVLCISMYLFFYSFSIQLSKNKCWKNSLQCFGFLAMLFGFLISTSYHNLMIILSSSCGIIVLLAILLGLKKHQLKFFLFSGTFCLLLLLANNLIYYTPLSKAYLPLIQKITFLLVLLWTVALNVYLFQLNSKVGSKDFNGNC